LEDFSVLGPSRGTSLGSKKNSKLEVCALFPLVAAIPQVRPILKAKDLTKKVDLTKKKRLHQKW